MSTARLRLLSGANGDTRGRSVEPEIREPHRDHVGRNELAHSNTGIEALRREVDKRLAGNDLHLNLGVGAAERGDDRLQHDWYDATGHGEPQKTAWFAGELARRFARRDEFLERRPCASMKAFACLG